MEVAKVLLEAIYVLLQQISGYCVETKISYKALSLKVHSDQMCETSLILSTVMYLTFSSMIRATS